MKCMVNRLWDPCNMWLNFIVNFDLHKNLDFNLYHTMAKLDWLNCSVKPLLLSVSKAMMLG